MDSYSQYNFNLEEYLKKKKNLKKVNFFSFLLRYNKDNLEISCY